MRKRYTLQIVLEWEDRPSAEHSLSGMLDRVVKREIEETADSSYGSVQIVDGRDNSYGAKVVRVERHDLVERWEWVDDAV